MTQYISTDTLRGMFDPEPSRNTIRNWVNSGELPKPRKIGKHNWWNRAVIEAHMQGNTGGLAGGLKDAK